MQKTSAHYTLPMVISTLFMLLIVTAIGLIFILVQVHAQEPEAQVAIFHEPQTEADRLPEPLAARTESIDLSTTRFLGQTESRAYWAAYHKTDDLCIIGFSEVGNGEWVSSIGCDAVEYFHRHGIWLTSSSDTDQYKHFSSAVFVPDGYTESATTRLTEANVTSNLIVFDTRESLESTASTYHGTVVVPPDAKADTHAADDLELQLEAFISGHR